MLDKRSRKDDVFQNKVTKSLKIDNVDFTQYDVIFLAGGWGAAYDLGQSDVLGEKISTPIMRAMPSLAGSATALLDLLSQRQRWRIF